MSTIVVGLDGSKGSIKALELALREARLRSAEIKAVTAWHLPPLVAQTDWIPPRVDESVFLVRTAQTIDDALAETGALTTGIPIHRIAREGPPGVVLCEEAQGAELLVVGSRGLGGFRGLLLGSVGRHVTQHAPCPVIVVAFEAEESSASGKRRADKPQPRSAAAPIDPPATPANL